MTTKPETCGLCNRRRSEPCARVECPLRRVLTAAPVGDPYYVLDRESGLDAVAAEGCYRRRPTNREE